MGIPFKTSWDSKGTAVPFTFLQYFFVNQAVIEEGADCLDKWYNRILRIAVSGFSIPEYRNLPVLLAELRGNVSIYRQPSLS